MGCSYILRGNGRFCGAWKRVVGLNESSGRGSSRVFPPNPRTLAAPFSRPTRSGFLYLPATVSLVECWQSWWWCSRGVAVEKRYMYPTKRSWRKTEPGVPESCELPRGTTISNIRLKDRSNHRDVNSLTRTINACDSQKGLEIGSML
jgi:hypothetical protein